jgi:hypothetical protein
MAGGYERVSSWVLTAILLFQCLSDPIQVNAQDDDDYVSPVEQQSLRTPNSPPPSFHSRASSPNRGRTVDPTLADAFDDPDESSDDEGDDRQRLVRRSSGPASGAATDATLATAASTSPIISYNASTPANAGARQQRVMGGGVGSDGVFANMSARPERVESEKEEMPPVRHVLHS